MIDLAQLEPKERAAAHLKDFLVLGSLTSLEASKADDVAR
jgi:hypothetical protein